MSDMMVTGKHLGKDSRAEMESAGAEDFRQWGGQFQQAAGCPGLSEEWVRGPACREQVSRVAGNQKKTSEKKQILQSLWPLEDLWLLLGEISYRAVHTAVSDCFHQVPLAANRGTDYRDKSGCGKTRWEATVTERNRVVAVGWSHVRYSVVRRQSH